MQMRQRGHETGAARSSASGLITSITPCWSISVMNPSDGIERRQPHPTDTCAVGHSVDLLVLRLTCEITRPLSPCTTICFWRTTTPCTVLVPRETTKLRHVPRSDEYHVGRIMNEAVVANGVVQHRKKGEPQTIPLNAEAIQEQSRKFREKFG